jgi:hypothetical protein
MKLRTKILIPSLLLLLLIGCAGAGIWYLRSDSFKEFARRSLVPVGESHGLESELRAFS